MFFLVSYIELTLNYLKDSAQIKVFYYQKNKKVYPYGEEK
jgi:hypothetical protein